QAAIESSQYGTVHPPWVKPPLLSFGDPGACITPSSVRKALMTSSRIPFLLPGRSPGRSTSVPRMNRSRCWCAHIGPDRSEDRYAYEIMRRCRGAREEVIAGVDLDPLLVPDLLVPNQASGGKG